jgi:hypothetical protein
MSVIAMCLLTIMTGILATNQINKLALGQPSPTDATTTFSMNGPICSLVFGMAPDTKLLI